MRLALLVAFCAWQEMLNATMLQGARVNPFGSDRLAGRIPFGLFASQEQATDSSFPGVSLQVAAWPDMKEQRPSAVQRAPRHAAVNWPDSFVR